MSSDELLDAHAKRLRNDPGYRAIWQRRQDVPVGLRMLAVMHDWAEQADGLRAMAREANTVSKGDPFLVECPACKRRFGLVLKVDGGPHV